MTDKNCKFYESCSAPMCPNLSDEDNSDHIWYPDEEICRKKNSTPSWVKQQRKIAKKAKPENHGYYFTLDMLKVRFRVTQNVKGLDPDNLDEQTQLNAWHKKHKGDRKRKVSKELKDKRRHALALARKAREQAVIVPIMEQV